MDYLDHVALARHASFAEFQSWRLSEAPLRRVVLLSTKASCAYTAFAFRPGDILMVGRESAGVPPDVFDSADACVTIPMQTGLRSLNVAVAAAMTVGEALRQIAAQDVR